MNTVAASDERRHEPGPEQWWAESWAFDFHAGGGALAGFARLAVYPRQGVAWCWAALAGTGRRQVVVRDDELSLPRGRDLELRGQGIWSAVTCETPLDHWSVGLEAFALAYDDPAEGWGRERGDLVALGLDLEWEATGPAVPLPAGDGYHQASRVTGEILVGDDERLGFDGGGRREHRWGVQDWSPAPAAPAAPGAPGAGPVDGAAVHLLVRGPDARAIRVLRALVAGSAGPVWQEWVADS